MADSFVIQSKPFFVRIIQPPEDRTGLRQFGRLIYSVFGLVGVTILVVCVAGLVIGSLLFWIRRRSA